MATVTGSLRLRPTRIGFLVAPTKMADVRKVIQVCSCLWGGAYNPIIPVCTELPEPWTDRHFKSPSALEFARGYLNFFEPDVFVEAEQGFASRLGLGDLRLSYGSPRIVSLKEFFEPEVDKRRDVPFGLSISDLYQDLYEREFQFVRRHERRTVLFGRGSTHDAFIEASLGGFPSEGLLAPLEKLYVDCFNPLRLAPSAENWIRTIKERAKPPLVFTADGITRDHDGYSEPTFFIVDPNSSTDLIDLWNIRLFKSPVFPVNADWLTDARDMLRELISSYYRPLPGNPHGVMTHATLEFGRSFSDKRATELATGLVEGLPNGSCPVKPWYDRIWQVDRTQDFIAQPHRARIYATRSDLDLTMDAEQKDKFIRFATLAPDFAEQYVGREARWVNVLKMDTYGADELAPVLPPDCPKDTLLRIRHDDGALVSREGLVLLQRFKNHRELLNLYSGTQLAIEWLGTHGVKVEVSSAGRILEQVLNSLGGFWGTSILAHKETLDALDGMAKRVRRHADGTTEEYPDRAKPVEFWQGLIRKRNNESKIHKDLNLEAFVKHGILRLGLSIDCPKCTNKNWVGLREIDEELVCEACRKRFDFPQGSLNFGRTPWQYRVVGPFSVPDYAQGAYATALALRVFAKVLGSGDNQITYSTSLKISDPPEFGEIDFVLWNRGQRVYDRDDETNLVFGECKSFAEESFKVEDIERMRRVAARFPGAFLVFATLKENLSESEKAAIREIALQGRERLAGSLEPRNPVIVLTAREMFSEWHIVQTWKEADGKHKEFASLGHISLGNLWTLAEITQQLYLGQPSASPDQVVPSA